MATMLPELGDGMTADINQSTDKSYTYKLAYDGDYQICGYCDELEAMKQAIFKIINTERYKYIIYGWNYGIELLDLIGKPIPYVYAEIERRIKEALLADDRITSVTNFSFSNSDGDVSCSFNVETIFGTVNKVSKVVSGVV